MNIPLTTTDRIVHDLLARQTNRRPVIEIVDPLMAQVLRTKGPAERLAIAWGLWRFARTTLNRTIAAQHPDWSEKHVQSEAIRRSGCDFSPLQPEPGPTTSPNAKRLGDVLMSPENLLYSLVQVFEQLKVPYFITDSVAAMTYGESRFTNDVDIVATLTDEHITAFCQALPPPDYYVSPEAMRAAIQTHRQFNVLHISEGVKADIIVPRHSEFNQSRFERSRLENVGSRGDAFVASPEDVIIKKLEYYREGQSEKHLRDIAGILQLCPYSIDYDYIAKWSAKMQVLDIWKLIVERLQEPEKDC